MESNLVCSEGEFSTAINKTTAYASFLVDMLGQYCTALEEVSSTGIKSKKVNQELDQLRSSASQCATALENLSARLASVMKKQVSDLEEADNFEYPDASMGDVISLLGSFL